MLVEVYPGWYPPNFNDTYMVHTCKITYNIVMLCLNYHPFSNFMVFKLNFEQSPLGPV